MHKKLESTKTFIKNNKTVVLVAAGVAIGISCFQLRKIESFDEWLHVKDAEIAAKIFDK